MRVSNFIWNGNEPAREQDILPAERLRQNLPEISGQFALHLKETDGVHFLVRDALGVNKLFFALGEQRVDSSNFLIDLVRCGHRLEDIWSVPSGHSLAINLSDKTLKWTRYKRTEFARGDAGTPSVDEHASHIRKQMAKVFRRLGKVLAGRRLYVALSGGLDSTTIAVAAREYLGDFTAVTFAVDDGSGRADASEDLHFAKLVAARLGVPIETVLATPDEIAGFLDVALVYGQDWRDFNVHCALVNARIAAQVAATCRLAEETADRPVILTGDTMNELMADYAPVPFRGTEYYPLPRLPPDQLRRFLVAGLDSGDREVGVYSRFQIDVIQPYALLADAYAALPPSCVKTPDAKQLLVRKIMGNKIPEEVYARPKVRAQVGDSKSVGGTLKVMVEAGLTGDRLRRRFAELFGCDDEARDGLIKAGFYRFPNAFPKKEAYA